MSRRLAAFRDFAGGAGADGIVLVRVARAAGSTPREEGAFMAVSAAGSYGTVGGGRLELEAIEAARRILVGGANEPLSLPLGPAIGQCCGGHVTLSFERLGPEAYHTAEALIAAEDTADPEVWLFGGGHVGRALVRALSLLPVKPHMVESRGHELALTPEGAVRHLSAMPESLVPQAASGAALIVLTHDHALDFLIVSAALMRPDLAFVGMIGSKTKRATFSHQFVREGGDEALLARLTCPIGVKIPDKRPEVIAATVASEVMVALSAASAVSLSRRG